MRSGTLWLCTGAGANFLEGGDLTSMDALGEKLLHDSVVHGAGGIVEQFGNYLMQPRNPHAEPWCEPRWPFTVGGSQPQQLQAWISGPNAEGGALVILTNLGPDEGAGAFSTLCIGKRRIHISLKDLGLTANVYNVHEVWGEGKGHIQTGDTSTEVSAELDVWESAMFHLTISPRVGSHTAALLYS